MKPLLVLLISCLAIKNGLAQEWQLVHSRQITGIDKLAPNNSGLLASLHNGDVLKIDTTGKILLRHSHQKNGPVTSIESWSSFKPVLFYSIFQELVILNRFYTETVRYELETKGLGFVSAASLNFEQNLWIVDEGDFMLKLLERKSFDLLTEQPFFQYLDEKNHDITFIKEYQNRLFVVDKVSGILMFDNLGSFIKKMDVTGVDRLDFKDEYFGWQNGGEYLVQEIYKGGQRALELPKSNYRSVCRSGDYFYCVAGNLLDIYRYLRQ
ncbi:MAG: hypothetical protein JXQ96_19180 [Cyclobacteriaceae bacterium]